jgi:hypothetical protein
MYPRVRVGDRGPADNNNDHNNNNNSSTNMRAQTFSKGRGNSETPFSRPPRGHRRDRANRPRNPRGASASRQGALPTQRRAPTHRRAPTQRRARGPRARKSPGIQMALVSRTAQATPCGLGTPLSLLRFAYPPPISPLSRSLSLARTFDARLQSFHTRAMTELPKYHLFPRRSKKPATGAWPGVRPGVRGNEQTTHNQRHGD